MQPHAAAGLPLQKRKNLIIWPALINVQYAVCIMRMQSLGGTDTVAAISGAPEQKLIRFAAVLGLGHVLVLVLIHCVGAYLSHSTYF